MKKGKRVVKKEPKVRLTIEEKEKKKLKIKRILLIILIIIILAIIAMVANNYIIFDNNKTTNLIINNKNVTSSLKNEVVIQDNIVYLSEADIANFFDKHIYEDKTTNKIITTYDKKIAEIGFKNNVININGSNVSIYAHAIEKKRKSIFTYI